MADVLTLGPDGLGDGGQALGWIEPLPLGILPDPQRSRATFLRILGAVLDRLDRYREAIDCIPEGSAPDDGNVIPEDAGFPVMAELFRWPSAALRLDPPYGCVAVGGFL